MGFCPLSFLFYDDLCGLSHYGAGSALVVEGSGCDPGFGVAIGYCGRQGISEVYVSGFAYFGHRRFFDHFFGALSVIKERGIYICMDSPSVC